MESVSRICVIELACDLCGDWKKLSHVLGLSREVEGISQDYRKNGVCEQAYRMLQAWKQKNGSDATYEVLRKALKRDPLSRVDLAEKYCDGGNQDTLKTGKRIGNFTVVALYHKAAMLSLRRIKSFVFARQASH